MSKITIPAFALCAALALSGCGGGDPPAESKKAVPAVNADEVSIAAGSPKLKRIRVEDVAAAPVPVDEVTAPGKVEANPNRMSHVVLPLAGRVVTVSAKIGDYVKQGDIVLSIESPDIDTAVSAFHQSEAGLTQARAGQAKAQADMDRARDLFEHNAIAQKEVINADALLAQAKAAVEQAQASVQQAKRRLEIYGAQSGLYGQRLAVHAPISGKVLEMNVVPGEFRNDLSAPLMTIADLSTVWVTSDVPETSIRRVQRGEPVKIEFSAYPGETFSGRVEQIADVVDPTTRTIKVRSEFSNRDGRLRPEMFGKIRHTERLENRPVVPASSVVQEDGRNVVWRETAPGVFRRVPVELGGRSGDFIAITQGLNAGDRVVTDGVMLIRN